MFKEKRHSIYLTSFFLTLLSCAAISQDKFSELDEIEVTATRLDSTLLRSSRSVSVVGKEDIQNATQLLAMDEILAGVPGLYMQNRYNFSQDLRVSLRGFGARSAFGIRGIKVIVDGIPETLPDGQAGVDSIDLGSASRIEVIRGPSSSNFGNASGGVIAIETETGSDPGFIQTTIATGDLGYSKFQLKSGGKTENMNYLINFSKQELDGYREHSVSEGSLMNAKFGFNLSEIDRLKLSLNYTDQPKSQDPGGINLSQVNTNRKSARDRNLSYDSGESLNQKRIGLVYERDHSSGLLTVRNYYVTRDFSNKLPFKNGGSVNIDREFYGFGMQYQFGESLPENFSLTTGFDTDRQDDDRKRFNNDSGKLGSMSFDQQEKVSSNGLFVQSRYDLGNWSISSGIRYDEVKFDITDRFLSNGDDSGEIEFDAVSPSFGLNYVMENASIFASMSSSFETPTTTELANPDASGGFNALLKPQEASNIEIGYKSVKNDIYHEIAVFNIDLNDELVPYELEEFPGRTFYSNVGKSSRKGIESLLSWSVKPNLTVDASYTYSDFSFDSFVDKNNKDFSGSKLPGLPESFAYFGIRFENESGLNMNFNLNYSGDLFANNANSVKVQAYTVSNFRLSYNINKRNWKILPYMGMNNIFDTEFNSNIRINAFGSRYYEPAPERNSYLGITFTRTL
jgi:iron complex outermembrane receptor protein